MDHTFGWGTDGVVLTNVRPDDPHAIFIADNTPAPGSLFIEDPSGQGGSMDVMLQEIGAYEASERHAVYIDWVGGPADLKYRNLRNSTTASIANNGYFFRPTVGGVASGAATEALVAWEEEVSGTREIRARTLASPTVALIGAGNWPSVSDGKVYFEDVVAGIVAYDFAGGTSTTIVPNSGTLVARRPSASGGGVAYEYIDPSTMDSSIRRYDLATANLGTLSTSLCTSAYQPRLGGDDGDILLYVADGCSAFQDALGNWHGGGMYLMLAKWDASTSTATTYFVGEFGTIPDLDGQAWFDIDGDHIAYTLDGRYVHMVDLGFIL